MAYPIIISIVVGPTLSFAFKTFNKNIKHGILISSQLMTGVNEFKVTSGDEGVIWAGQMNAVNFTSNTAELRSQFAKDGYLLLRNYLPRELIQSCQNEIKELLFKENFTDSSNDLTIPEALISSESKESLLKSPGLLGRQDWIKERPIFKQVFEHQLLFDIVKVLMKEEAPKVVHLNGKSNGKNRSGVHKRARRPSSTTVSPESSCTPSTSQQMGSSTSEVVAIPFKWLRAVGTGLYTGLHNDGFYVKKISSEILTVWVPLDEITLGGGGLVVAPGSHSGQKWKGVRDLYDSPEFLDGQKGGDGTTAGWLARDPNTVINLLANEDCDKEEKRSLFETTKFKMGDVVILGLDTIHFTSANLKRKWRLSCDCRFILV